MASVIQANKQIMKYTFPLLAIVMGMIVFSCRSARKIQTAITINDSTHTVKGNDSKADSIKFIQQVFSKVKNNRIDFKTFSAKIKVDYTDKNGNGPDLTVFARIQKDSVIWLSVNATVFSYEAIRILIKPDSVIVLDRKDKQVQFRTLSYLQELTHIPFDFSMVQDLIVGNAIYLDSNIISFKKNETSVSLISTGKFFRNLLTVNSGDFTLQHSKLDDLDLTRSRICDLTYSDYENKNGAMFSTGRKIAIAEKSKLGITMNFKQYSFNETLSYPFSIPKNYKRN